MKHFATSAATVPRTECLKSLFGKFCLHTLLWLIERVQSCMPFCVFILCTRGRGHSVFYIHLFSMYSIKY